MEESIYFTEFQVASKDCTSRQTIKLPNLLDYMQEAAWRNATSIGFSTLDLMRNNITWVMNRMKIRFDSFPVQGQQFKIETWPSDMDKYLTKRDFRVWGERGELLLDAASDWLVMDINQRKLIPIPDYIKEAKFVLERNNLPPAAGKLTYDHAKTENRFGIQVSWFDLDINNHVNNTKFYQWVLDSLGADILNNHELKEIDVVFKREVKYGDKLESHSYLDSNGKYRHCLKNTVSNQVCVLAVTVFAVI